MNKHHALIEFIEALHATRARALAAYCEMNDKQEDDVECVFSDYDLENGKVTWLCYPKGSFIQWPSQAFMDGPLWPMLSSFGLDGGTLDLGLTDA